MKNIKDAVWVVRSYIKRKKDKIFAGFGGGICIHQSGIIMTTYVAACPVTVIEATKLVVEDPHMFFVSAAGSSPRFQQFRDLKLISTHPLEGVLFFKVAEKEEGEYFPCIDLYLNGDGSRINEGDRLSSLIHEGGYGLVYSAVEGKANFVFDPAHTDLPIDRDNTLTSISDDDYTNMKNETIQLNLGVRTIGGVASRSGIPGDSAAIAALDALDALDLDQSFDRIPEAYMMHVQMPLIQMSGFGTHSYLGQSGCPVYGTEDFSFHGMIIFTKGIYTFALPLKVLKHCCDDFRRISNKRKKDGEGSSSRGGKGRDGGHGRGRDGGHGGGRGRGGGGGGGGKGPYHPKARMEVVFTIDQTLSRPQQLSQQGRILEAAIEAAASAIIDLKDNLNDWDSKSGDGDCGSTMCKGATFILEDLKKHYPLNDAAETINEIGSSIRRVMMGGTSGIIYDIFSKAAYAHLKAKSESVVTPLSCEMITSC